jgi:hypothetical protein
VRAEDGLREHGWQRMGFETTVPPTAARRGFMHLRLAYRAPRIVEDSDGRYQVVVAEDDAK